MSTLLDMVTGVAPTLGAFLGATLGASTASAWPMLHWRTRPPRPSRRRGQAKVGRRPGGAAEHAAQVQAAAQLGRLADELAAGDPVLRARLRRIEQARAGKLW